MSFQITKEPSQEEAAFPIISCNQNAIWSIEQKIANPTVVAAP